MMRTARFATALAAQGRRFVYFVHVVLFAGIVAHPEAHAAASNMPPSCLGTPTLETSKGLPGRYNIRLRSTCKSPLRVHLAVRKPGAPMWWLPMVAMAVSWKLLKV